MEGGKKVAAALRDGKDGGIPWFVFLDPSKPVFVRNSVTGLLQRREAAILATADASNGNVGCPMTLEERTHFLASLASSRKELIDDQLLKIAELQRQFCSSRGKEYGKAVSGIPVVPQTFDELESLFKADMFAFRKELIENREKGKKVRLPSKYGVHEKLYPKFRALGNNYLAPPADRGQALLWCFANFRSSSVAWKNPGKIQASLVNTLITEWADADWASGLASAIVRNKTAPGFDADSALIRLESMVKSPTRQADAAYHRANLHRRGDEEKLDAALAYFIKQYPNDSRVARAEGYLRNTRLLTVGKQAPEFSGKDADGNPIALSDYRGKVTFLVFWGFW